MRIFVLSIIQKGAFSFGKLCQQCSNLWSLTVQFWDRNFFRVIHISNRTLKLPNCDNDCIRILIKLHFNIFRTSWYWSLKGILSTARTQRGGGQVRKLGGGGEGKWASFQVRSLLWRKTDQIASQSWNWKPFENRVIALVEELLPNSLKQSWGVLQKKNGSRISTWWKKNRKNELKVSRGRSQKRAKKSHNEHTSSSSHSVSSSKYDGECL